MLSLKRTLPLAAGLVLTSTSLCSALPSTALEPTRPQDAARAPGRDRRDSQRAASPRTDAKLNELRAKTKARQGRGIRKGLAIADSAQVREWFLICDFNANGWLSYAEASYSLRFTRKRFQAFDSDRDGRLEDSEFDELYMYSILHAGQFAEPRERRRSSAPPRRSPEQLRNAYDIDIDGLINASELARLLTEYGRDAGDSEAILSSIDSSEDGQLSVEELRELHAVLYPVVIEDGPPNRGPEDSAPSIWGVFGMVVPRNLEPGSTPTPPLITGPVPHFRRLDLDHDGYISVDDLEALLRPMRVSVRPHTVINTLDSDGDNRLSAEEFLSSMTNAAR